MTTLGINHRKFRFYTKSLTTKPSELQLVLKIIQYHWFRLVRPPKKSEPYQPQLSIRTLRIHYEVCKN